MNVHIVSDSPRMNSGLGVIGINLALGLKGCKKANDNQGYDVTMTGLQTAYMKDWYEGIEILPIEVRYIDQVSKLIQNINRVQADVVINVLPCDVIDTIDFAMAGFNGLENTTTKKKRKVIWYAPIEAAKGLPWTTKSHFNRFCGLESCGRIVCMSKYGQTLVQQAGFKAEMIYPGYDDKIYNDKVEDYCYYNTVVGRAEANPKNLAKSDCYNCKDNYSYTGQCGYKVEEGTFLEWNKDENEGKGGWVQWQIPIPNLKSAFLKSAFGHKFVFLFVGQNNGLKKRIERLLEAYAIMIDGNRQIKDRTHLHLHTMPISLNGINLIQIVQELGIQENVSFSYGDERSSGWSSEALNCLYNSVDYRVTASSGEGFDLITLESMACGLPQIAPNTSSFIEMIGDGPTGLLAKVESYAYIQDGSKRALVDIQDLAIQMKKMYISDDLSARFSKHAKEKVKSFTWSNIIDKWDKYLSNDKEIK